ncbi:hypothetical protein EES39_11870 [Streptomyces sp. ADI92-24]|nr:hypothetical protein EES39_11870 [Streptomyces sp. ADI92-24]
MRPTAEPSARLPSSSASASRPRCAPAASLTRASTCPVRATVSRSTSGSRPAPSPVRSSGAAAGRGTRADTGGSVESAGPLVAPGSSRTTRSATDRSAGRCTTSSTVRPAASLRTASTMPASVSPSRLAVGSSSSSTGRSARNARASARRCRCPAERPEPSSPRRVAAPSGSSVTKSYAPASRSAAVTALSSASGRASRTFSAIVPAKRCGRCGTQAIRSRQRSGERSARSVPPTRTRPSSGAAKPSTTFSRVDLPTPLGPTRATVSPSSTTSEAPAREGSVRPACRTVTPSISSRSDVGTSCVPPARGSVSRTEKISSAAERPSAAAWYCAPTCLSGR